ncbi:hypothetical protein JCM25156A_32910 [Komagataeibacter kakiaceti JCM 25156]
MSKSEDSTLPEWLEKLSLHDKQIARSLVADHGESCLRRIFEAMPKRGKGRVRENLPLKWIAVAYDRYLFTEETLSECALPVAEEIYQAGIFSVTKKTIIRKLRKQLEEIKEYGFEEYANLLVNVALHGHFSRNYSSISMTRGEDEEKGLFSIDIDDVQTESYLDNDFKLKKLQLENSKKNFIEFVNFRCTELSTSNLSSEELDNLYNDFRIFLIYKQIEKFSKTKSLRERWEGKVFPRYFHCLLPFS